MANKFTSFLDNVGQGLTNPKGNLGDFRHAARLFIDDTFRLAPKQKFLFFVNFELSPDALALFPQLRNRHLPEINMLVKTADLPQYSANIDVKNQYNRKKVVQTAIEYTPVTLTMHDDNIGVTTLLLEAYYKYYYRDSRQLNVADAYDPRNTYSRDRTGRYGLDNGTVRPFFKNIRLYQLSRQQFTEYTLINPMVERWGHDSMDYSDGVGTAENTLVLNYEAVLYDRGRIDEDTPATFATTHYDNVPSPLDIQGGGVENLFGAGGVLDGASSILGDVASGDFSLGTLLSTANTIKNARELTRDGVIQEGVGILNTALSRTGQGGTGGLAGTTIPKSQSAPAEQTTAASPTGGAEVDRAGKVTEAQLNNQLNRSIGL